jgi:hypothetical protein
MSYVAVMSDKAEEDLRHAYALAVPLGDQLLKQLEFLLEDPIHRSLPSFGYPYPKGQIRNWEFQHAGRRYAFAILFKYRDSKTENDLHIIELPMAEIPDVEE